jgi:hypothetical protein
VLRDMCPCFRLPSVLATWEHFAACTGGRYWPGTQPAPPIAIPPKHRPRGDRFPRIAHRGGSAESHLSNPSNSIRRGHLTWLFRPTLANRSRRNHGPRRRRWRENPTLLVFHRPATDACVGNSLIACAGDTLQNAWDLPHCPSSRKMVCWRRISNQFSTSRAGRCCA